MADPRFFDNAGPFTIRDILQHIDADGQSGHEETLLRDVKPLGDAGAEDLSFFDNAKYLDAFLVSKAGACFVKRKYAENAPEGMIALICEDPYRAYALAAQQFYPSRHLHASIHPGAVIDSSATIGGNTDIAAGAVIAEDVVIGQDCQIGANAVIEKGVSIGNGTVIGANTVISHAEIGDHVTIHRNVSIGQDGFGFALGRQGHEKVPQLGRVIIESHVDIGAGTCIDRGAGPDTIIGMGTKIDNLVQIGHNVKIGAGSIITAQVGISGSTELGRGVIVGGQVGIAGHLKIGDGVQLAGRAGVTHNLEGGKAYGGTPAVPIKHWHRQTIALNALAKKNKQGVTSD